MVPALFRQQGVPSLGLDAMSAFNAMMNYLLGEGSR